MRHTGRVDPDNGELRLVSGEAVELDIRVARAGSRVPALLIDIVVQLMLFYGLLLLASILMLFLAATLGADEVLFAGVVSVVVVVVLIGYPAAMETLTRGRTIGKLALGLRVVRDDGGPIRFRQALTRALVGATLEWPGLVLPPLTWVVSLWTMIANRHGKRLGDLAAGTIVIHERTPEGWGWVPTMPPQLAGWARTLDLTGLDDDLALAVRHFLARNRQLKEPARSRLGFALAQQVAAVTNPPVPPGTDGWAYLAAVLAERHRRAAAKLAAARARTSRVFREQAPAPAGLPAAAVAGVRPAAEVGVPAAAGADLRPAAPAGASPSRIREPYPR